MSSLNCFSQAETRGAILICDEHGSREDWEDEDKAGKKESGCSATAKVCVDVHTYSFYELVKVMDTASPSKEIGSSSEAKVCVDIHKNSSKLSCE